MGAGRKCDERFIKWVTYEQHFEEGIGTCKKYWTYSLLHIMRDFSKGLRDNNLFMEAEKAMRLKRGELL